MDTKSFNPREVQMGRKLMRAEIPSFSDPTVSAFDKIPQEAAPKRELVGLVAIGEDEVARAAKILAEYKAQKQHFDAHVVADEDWWRIRHWDEINARDGESLSAAERGEIDPKSAWLLSNVMDKHADYMDAVPTFAVLPREEGDVRAATLLTKIIPQIYERNDFEQKYNDACLAKCKHGTGVYGVFWDGASHGGLGDIVIDEIDCLQLFWEGGINDIQDSENLFYVVKMSRDAAQDAYPELADKIKGGALSGTVEEYRGDDYQNDSEKVEVVDWYYKKHGILHCCKFCQGIVLSATENDPDNYPHGLYAHGMYPFFVDPYYKIKNSPGGFGIIDVDKSDQEQIDRTARAMMNNVLGSSVAKTFVGESAGVNEEDIADPKKQIVKFSGTLDESNFRTVQPNAHVDMYMSVISQKVSQMKETSGNRDVSSGNAPSGVTAASAIAALQEQAGKTSRDAIKGTYRVFVRITKCIIELIREFYTMPRIFRITGDTGESEYVSFSNKDMVGRTRTRLDGTPIDINPEYDVIVSAQKASPYSAMAQNELALEFYKGGFFEPSRADAAIATLQMMDFRDKERIIQTISRNGTMYQQLVALSERLAAAERALGIGAPSGAAFGAAAPRDVDMPEQNREGVVSGESSITKKARERSAETVIPR